MSKLSQLKQDAYQAGKKRDWDSAVTIYEQILEMDKSNPSLVNELGDLCLKAGDSRTAVKHFLSAASKYRTNGLLNNAVAIYKKILRHDVSNLNAHWYLAETRASQGLMVEGETHGVQFLENSADVSGDIKEIFLKRCVKLFDLYSSSTAIMEPLLQIFRMWEMHIEAARVSCILSCQRWDAGEQDRARESMTKVLSRTPDIIKYPEHAQWQDRINPSAVNSGGGYSDVNALDLGDGSGAEQFVEPEKVTKTSETDFSIETAPIIQTSEPVEIPIDPFETTEQMVPAEQPSDSWGGVSFDSLLEDASPTNTVVESPMDGVSHEVEIPESPVSVGFERDLPSISDELAQDEDGCFSLDTDTQANFDDLISQATQQVESKKTPQEVIISDDLSTSSAEEEQLGTEPAGDEQVDLLAQILAEDSGPFGSEETSQVATITEEIGAKVGSGDEGDGASLYEMGLVYLEMDMHDQACDSFEKAVGNPEYAIRAHEMWGITLLRSGKLDEAVIILTAGLDLPEEGSRQQLGMLYHLGRAQEQAERFDEAEDCYKQIHELDRSFLDVGSRLAGLARVK